MAFASAQQRSTAWWTLLAYRGIHRRANATASTPASRCSLSLREGASLDEELQQQIRQALRSVASPRHVPAEIVAVPSVPRTVTGKLAELAVTDIVNGDQVRNTSGLIDPSALECFFESGLRTRRHQRRAESLPASRMSWHGH